jgi:broad specificity phosphatase PhoE
MLLRYLTHPQVRIDPTVPVPLWGLRDIGHARVNALAAAGWLAGTATIVSSAETKALETARPLADTLGLEVVVREAMHENDRSATGYLPPPEFEQVADAFFAAPEASVRGWERAIDAQTRIVREAEAVLAGHRRGDVLLVGHGGVGTLLLCHFARLKIARMSDQPGGGGNYWTVDVGDRTVRHGWRAMEEPPA